MRDEGVFDTLCETDELNLDETRVRFAVLRLWGVRLDLGEEINFPENG
jgi:hypothetical protein